MERDETPGYVFPGALVPQSFLVFPAIYSRTAGAYPGFLPETVGGFRFLHAYSGINCRDTTGARQTDRILSWMVLSNSHSLLLQQPVFVLSRLCSLVTGQPATRPK